MKLGLSKKGDPRGRHLVFVCDKFEELTVDKIIRREILKSPDGKPRLPVKEWDAAKMVFRYRFAVKYLEVLMAAFPKSRISPGIRKKLRIDADKRMKALPAPDIDVPGFVDTKEKDKKGKPKKAKLHHHQRVNINLAMERLEEDGWFMINDDLGLGKTITALAIIVLNYEFPVLVVVPNNGKWSWKRIMDRFFPGITYEIIDGTKAQKTNAIRKRADVTIVNFEALRVKQHWDKHKQQWVIDEIKNPEFFTRRMRMPDGQVKYRPMRWPLVVVDEHHRVKTEGAQQTNGFMHLKPKKLLLMSGTPIMNRLEEIWTVLHKTNPERFPTFYAFVQEFCIKDGSGKVIAYHPEKVMELKRYLERHSIRWRADQIGKRMPKVVRNPIYVELTAEQWRLYTEIRDEYRLWLADGSKKTIFSILAQITRLKQACWSPELYGGSPHSAKLEALKDDIAQLVEEGHKAIIFSQWAKATRILEREFAEYMPAYVDGSVKGKKRMHQEDRFNEDPDCSLYIGVIAANREAITLSAATYVAFTDKEWAPGANKQALGRSAAGGLRGIHLPKGARVHSLEYIAKDTIEEQIEDTLGDKEAEFNAFFEQDGGVVVPKRMLKDLAELVA